MAQCKRKADAIEILDNLSNKQEEWRKLNSKRKKPTLTSTQLKTVIQWKQDGKGTIPDKADD